jgi:hypothetical protein
MSGAVMTMSRLSDGLAAPRLFRASASAFDSNPALFQSEAQAAADRSRPAALTAATAATLPASRRKDLRKLFMIHPIETCEAPARSAPVRISKALREITTVLSGQRI